MGRRSATAPGTSRPHFEVRSATTGSLVAVSLGQHGQHGLLVPVLVLGLGQDRGVPYPVHRIIRIQIGNVR